MNAEISRWPFWAPTPDGSIEYALDLAGVKPGEHVLDLGCGDGRVLEAAVKRGATATGYEADPVQVARARERIAGLEGAARVEEADFYTAPLEADVIFAFLSPATLFRLRNRLASLAPGTRVVTFGFGLWGWAFEKHSDDCFLYRLPVRPSTSPFEEGWSSAAVVVGGPPGRSVLVALPFGARTGRVEVEVSTTLEAFAYVFPGATSCSADVSIPVDIKVTPRADGLHIGGVRIQGHELLVLVIGGGELRRRLVPPEELEALYATLHEVRTGKREAASLLSASP